MDDDHRELVTRLFATATARLEDAIAMAVGGQSPRRTASQLGEDGRRLQTAAHAIAVHAEAATIVANTSVNQRRKRRSRAR